MSDMVPIDREGDFRARVIGYGLKKADSGAVGVRVQVHILEVWNPVTKSWEDWSEANVEAWGTQWIIKKDNGGIHKGGVEALVNHCGWDGNLKSIVENSWVPTPCRVSIQAETYEGKTEYRVNFISAYDSVPGLNVGNVDLDGVKALDAQFGAQLRAVVGNAKRNTAPPPPVNGKVGPKPPARSAPAPELETVPPQRGPDDEIPF